MARVGFKNDNNKRSTDREGRKRDSRETDKLQMDSALTALSPSGCLSVLAVVTKRASERVWVSVGRETKITSPVGVGQKRGCQEIDCLQKYLSYESLYILAMTAKAGSAIWTEVCVRVRVGRGAKPISIFECGWKQTAKMMLKLLKKFIPWDLLFNNVMKECVVFRVCSLYPYSLLCNVRKRDMPWKKITTDKKKY